MSRVPALALAMMMVATVCVMTAHSSSFPYRFHKPGECPEDHLAKFDWEYGVCYSYSIGFFAEDNCASFQSCVSNATNIGHALSCVQPGIALQRSLRAIDESGFKLTLQFYDAANCTGDATEQDGSERFGCEDVDVKGPDGKACAEISPASTLSVVLSWVL